VSRDGGAGPTLDPSELEALAGRIEGDIEELLATKFVRPVPVRVASRADLHEFAERGLLRLDPAERMRADGTIAKLLGLIPPDMDLAAATLGMFETVEQEGGYYDAPGGCFCLTEGTGKELAPAVVAHELVHALDDQVYGFDRELLALAGNTDASNAYFSVVEGSATLLCNRWLIDYGSDETGEAYANGPGPALTVPMRIWLPFVASYWIGPAFLARGDDTALGQSEAPAEADVERAFRTPPRSSEQVLHPEKYWDPVHLDEPRAIVLTLADLPQGWTVERQDTLGELMLAILCTPPEERVAPDESKPGAELALRFTNDIAAGWGGDRALLLAKGDARYLVLVTRWDSTRDAREFYDAMLQLQSCFEAAARALAGSTEAGSGVELAYGASDDEVVLTIHSAVDERDLGKLRNALELKAR